VADGIGGAPAGEVASEIVIGALRALEDAPEPDDPRRALREALAEANRQIGAAAEADPARQGMGTTVTALMVAGDQLVLLHVGDVVTAPTGHSPPQPLGSTAARTSTS